MCRSQLLLQLCDLEAPQAISGFGDQLALQEDELGRYAKLLPSAVTAGAASRAGAIVLWSLLSFWGTMVQMIFDL